MDNDRIHRYGGAALVVSAISLAVFWIFAASIGTFAGADAARRPSWIPSQALHAIGALFSIFGYMSVYAVERRLSGWSGLVGFVVATTGNVLFFADGLIALAIFPALAVSAPVALSASGAMNQGGVLAMFVVIAAINMIGR